MASNIWKEIPPGNEKEINAVIEIPKGSRNKYEYDIDNGIFILDRVLFTPFHYPVNYAFIPQTWSTDEDPADIMVLSDEPLPQGTLVKCRPVAFLKMIDGGDKDDKILAVPVDDVRSKHIRDKDDLPPHLLEEIAHMMLRYKELEGKKVEVKGWGKASEAQNSIKKAIKRYKDKFAP